MRYLLLAALYTPIITLLLLLPNRLENEAEFIHLEIPIAPFQSMKSACFPACPPKTVILPVATDGYEVSSARGKNIDLV
jgi:hypothetical protein